ncbi:MAG: hypothetical protein ACOYMA_12805, partial [Bacteroidia bacterium]
MNRNDNILNIRLSITTDESKDSLDEESFQNNTLRPILKFQNEIIIAIIKHHLEATFLSKNKIDKIKIIENFIQKNSVIKNQLIGLTIALFTTIEFDYYLQNQTKINKRISQLI